jgi:hydroxymethylpyrimidine pyrophosphatase-like HAD family hydrolase
MELANKIVKLIEEDKINESFKYSNDYMRYMELEKKIRKEGVFEEYKEKKEPFNYSNNYMELNYMEFKNKMTKVQYDNNKLLEENKELKERFKEYSLNIHYMNGNINDIIHEMNGKFTFYELGFNPGLQW